MNKADRLMNYLYGEMTGEERRSFEELLREDPELQAELEALQATRDTLAALPDVVPPAQVFALPAQKPLWRRLGWRAAAAAAMLLLLWGFNARLELRSSALIFTMGNPGAVPEQVRDEPSAESIVAAALAIQERQLERQLMRLDSLWQEQLEQRESAWRGDWQRQFTNFQQQRKIQMETLMDEFRKEELPRLAGMVQHLQLQQQAELRALLTDFWTQWQQTRAADLQSIESEFVNLYRNVELNQTETQAVLRDLMRGGD